MSTGGLLSPPLNIEREKVDMEIMQVAHSSLAQNV